MNSNHVGWPCEYCKIKFIDVISVINHEIYLCDKNPRYRYDSFKLENDFKKKNELCETIKNEKHNK